MCGSRRRRDANEKTLTSLKDEIASIRTAGKHFKTSIDGVLSAIESLDANPATRDEPRGGELPVLPG